MIKAIALDIDGTLLNNKKQISYNTVQAIGDAMERGIEIILATGRPHCGAVSYAEELDLYKKGGYILCFNGGRIIECKTGEIIYDAYLDEADKHEICRILRGYSKAAVMTYDGDVLISEKADNEDVLYGAKLNKLILKGVEDLREHIGHKVGKFVLMGAPDYIKKITDDVTEKMGNMATVCRSESNLLEIMPYGVDKGSALRFFAEKMNIEQKQIMAFGDAYNDDTMIEYAGIGVAMGNAFEEIKELADYVTLSNDEDGVAHAIRKFAL